MGWAGERRRQGGARVALCGVQLGLDEKHAAGQVGTTEVGTSKVRTGDVGQSEVGTSQVRSNEVGASQAGPSEVGAFKVDPDEVRCPMVHPVRDIGSQKLARGQKQVVDPATMCLHVQLHEDIRALASQAFGRLQRTTELTVERVGRAA